MRHLFFLIPVYAFATTATIQSAFFRAKGVLVHPKVVITVAHGLKNRGRYYFNHNYQGTAYLHPKYAQGEFPFDIAVLVLDHPCYERPTTPTSSSFQKEGLFIKDTKLTFGDSGTPFICDGKVEGIAVAIMGRNKEDYKVLYLCVHPHKNWIQEVFMLHTKEEELLFPWIETQIANKLQTENKEKKELINLGIGDTCDPLPLFVGDAIKGAIQKMERVHVGYGAEQGDSAFREAVAQNVYGKLGISKEEVFVTEGIANSLGMLISLFPKGGKIGVLAPTYPVYKSLLEVEGMEIVEIPAGQNFCFSPPSAPLDALILCSPNNPTGIAFSREELQAFVDYAKESSTLILFDGAYESFVFDNSPRSIYEIEGAKSCAIELRSFSKTLGFSGLRLGYFIAPKELRVHALCKKIITAKTNGVSFPIQQGGIAALSKQGLETARKFCKKYMEQTTSLKNHLQAKGETVFGGSHAPYLFWKVGNASKEMFVHLLQEHDLITIPGVGFGKEGFLRLSGFINDETLLRACKALQF